MSLPNTPGAPSPPSVVIFDASGTAAPWLLRAIDLCFPAKSFATRVSTEVPRPETGSVAFVAISGPSDSLATLVAVPGTPVTAVFQRADPAAEDAALAAGAFDVLVLQDATPRMVQAAIQRMVRALATESTLAKRTQELLDSRKHIHDINNSLATILTVAEELMDNPQLDARARSSAKLIFDTTREAAVRKQPANTAPPSSPPVAASPAATTPAAAAPPSPPKPESAGNRILIIEDQPDLGRLVSLTLRSKGFDVLLAQSADEGVRLAGENGWQIAAILSDIVMEGRSTREAVAEIREHAPEAGIIFMSAYAPGEFLASGDIPADAHFLQKPFTAAELAQAVKAAISA